MFINLLEISWYYVEIAIAVLVGIIIIATIAVLTVIKKLKDK